MLEKRCGGLEYFLFCSWQSRGYMLCLVIGCRGRCESFFSEARAVGQVGVLVDAFMCGAPDLWRSDLIHSVTIFRPSAGVPNCGLYASLYFCAWYWVAKNKF